MWFLLPAENTLHFGAGELISSVGFDTYQRKLFLRSHSKLYDGVTLQSEVVASDLKLQSAEQVAVWLQVEHKNISFSFLPTCPFVQHPWSLSLSLSQHPSMVNCNRLLTPHHFALLIQKNQDTHQTKLTCYSKAFTFSQVYSAPQVSGWTAFSPDFSSYNVLNPHTLLLYQRFLPIGSPLLSLFLFGGWAKAGALRINTCYVLSPGQIRIWSVLGLLGLHWAGRTHHVNVSHRSVSLKVHCEPSQTSIFEF